MPRLFLFLLMLLTAQPGLSQTYYQITFEDTAFLNKLIPDTISNPFCRWQVGQPQKTIFTSTYSGYRGLMTDTLNPLPPNDTSILYLHHKSAPNAPYRLFSISFMHRIHGAPGDYGKLELSPDSGATWIDVLKDDTAYGITWPGGKPSFNAGDTAWRSFDVQLFLDNGLLDGIPVGDTILVRLSFITDSTNMARDGWIIDPIWVTDVTQLNVAEPGTGTKRLVLAPQPAGTILHISLPGTELRGSLKMVDLAGRTVMDIPCFEDGTLDVGAVPPGIYTLLYSDATGVAAGKCMIAR